MKDKTAGTVRGPQGAERRACAIEVLDIEGKGYIHQVDGGAEESDGGFELIERAELGEGEDREEGVVRFDEQVDEDDELVSGSTLR